MKERENLAAGIYAILSMVTLAACLFLAFLLPPWVFLSKWLALPALAGLFIALPWLLRLAQRSRIEEAVRLLGGTLYSVRKLPRRLQPSDTFFFGENFEVKYGDLLAATHLASCRAGFFQGVEWVEDVVVEPAPARE